MKFTDLQVAVNEDQIVLSQQVVDPDGDVRYYDITIPPEQAIIVAKAIRELAYEILGEDDE